MTGGIGRLARSSAVHVSFAFLAMGGWALYANRGHSTSEMLMAGLVQGVLSGCLTLFLKSVIERLSRRFSGAAALWAPPLIACIGSAALLLLVHAISATPEILRTIAVPLTVSTSYAVLYNYSISRGRIRTHGAAR
jgi:LytS/YehU family sensor histidine kinase